MLGLPASTVFAQPAPGRLVLGAGVTWMGSTTIGATDATETASNGAGFRLFATRTTLAASAGVEGSLGVRLTGSIDAEFSTAYGPARLRTRISGDAEGAADVTATESLNQLLVGGSIVLHVARWRLSARAMPFLLAGAGYLRQLHEGRTLAETGRVYRVGAGLNYQFRRSPARRGAGVRIDGRALIRSGGVTFDGKRRVEPAVGASLFARF
jgi:hypothetical protein